MTDREKVIAKFEKEVKKTYSIKTTIYNNGKKVNEDITEHREPGIKISMEMADEILALLKEQETKTGHWIYKKYDDMFMCSCCEKYSIRNDYPYCHWCGARMEGREVNE